MLNKRLRELNIATYDSCEESSLIQRSLGYMAFIKQFQIIIWPDEANTAGSITSKDVIPLCEQRINQVRTNPIPTGDEKNHLEHDKESEKTHLCDETAGLGMIENDGGTEDNRTIASLLVNSSGAAWMFDDYADDVAEGFAIP